MFLSKKDIYYQSRRPYTSPYTQPQAVRVGGGSSGVTYVGGRGSLPHPLGTAQDFTPYGYVSRPGSTPMSYSLWGSSSSSEGSENSYKRKFNRSFCRVAFGCAIILVVLAVLGIVGIAIYLGDNVIYQGQLRITKGDSWLSDLNYPATPVFKAKAIKYEKMLDTVYELSFLRDAISSIKVIGFEPNSMDQKGFVLKFHISLDRRKLPNHISSAEGSVKEILEQEIMSLNPKAFYTVGVDIDSLNLFRITETTYKEKEARPSPQNLEIIKLSGTEQSPGGSILRIKPFSEGLSQGAVRTTKLGLELVEKSTMSNLVYQFGPWRPVNPINAANKTDARRRHFKQPFRNLTSTQEKSESVPVGPPDGIRIIDPPYSATYSPTSSVYQNPLTNPPTRVSTITTTTTTSTTTTSTTTSTTPEITSVIEAATKEQFNIHEIIDFSNIFRQRATTEAPSPPTTTRIMTTRKNPSKEDIKSIIEDLLLNSPTVHSPLMKHSSEITLSEHGQSRHNVQETQTENKSKPSFPLITYQSVSDPKNEAVDLHLGRYSTLPPQISVTELIKVPDNINKYTSYSGVQNPLMSSPILSRIGLPSLPIDKFRLHATTEKTSPATIVIKNDNFRHILATNKPLLLNSEIVTSTSVDVNFGKHSENLFAPVYLPNRDPQPLDQFTEEPGFVTVPVISGNNIKFITINRTRTNYPNVVIVNLSPEPVRSTTPVSPVPGKVSGKRLNTKFLDDIFEMLMNTESKEKYGNLYNFDMSKISGRQGKPIDLGVEDARSPLKRSEYGELSLWNFLRNLSTLHLSDPAIIQQLQDYDARGMQISSQTQKPATSSNANIQKDLVKMIPVLEYLSKTSSLKYNENPSFKNLNTIANKTVTQLPTISNKVETSTLLTGYTFDMSTAKNDFYKNNDMSTTQQASNVFSTSSPVKTFSLKQGQSMEELLVEIFDTISPEIESTTDIYKHPDIKNNSSQEQIKNSIKLENHMINHPHTLSNPSYLPLVSSESTSENKTTIRNATETPFVFELFPVMTRPMNKVFTPKPELSSPSLSNNAAIQNSTDMASGSVVNNMTDSNLTLTECDSPDKFKCKSGNCVSTYARCNMKRECSDSSDEEGCKCSDYLRSQLLTRKVCDSIVDCWDMSDETACDWCQEGHFLCVGSRKCIEQTTVCDGTADCPDGSDERECLTLAPDESSANHLQYHEEGYVLVRRNGIWGKLCIENFENAVKKAHSLWTVSDLGETVCRTLTLGHFRRVERLEDRSPPISRSATRNYFEISVDPSTSDTKKRRKSRSNDFSMEFKDSSCFNREVLKVACAGVECGRRPRARSHKARIVGGNNSGPGFWPWHAALYKEGSYQCGATLINIQWIISAGHCFSGATNAYWVARFGALRRGAKFPSPYEQTRVISHIFIHPNYIEENLINDISVLRLQSPVEFTDYIRPVCLPPPSTPVQDGRQCTLVGWGQLFESERVFPDTLQEVQVPLISTSECKLRTILFPLYRLTENMFCAGYDRGGRDACLGDSGGSLVCQEDDGHWLLMGVTSNGYGCARPNRPGVYTKVVNYLGWIHQIMQLNDAVDSKTQVHSCSGLRCPLGNCVNKKDICNGVIDCSDGSDEKNCP